MNLFVLHIVHSFYKLIQWIFILFSIYITNAACINFVYTIFYETSANARKSRPNMNKQVQNGNEAIWLTKRFILSLS